MTTTPGRRLWSPAVEGWKAFLYPLSLVVGFGLAVLGAYLVTPHGEHFETITGTDEFKLWRALIGIMLASTVASNLVTAPLAWTMWQEATPRHRRVLVISTVVSAIVAGTVLFLAPLLANVYIGSAAPLLVELRTRLLFVFAVQMVFLLPAILVIIGVNDRARAIVVTPPTTNADPEPTEIPWKVFLEIRALRASLKTALTWVAIPVSFVVIVTGQLRNALVAENSDVAADIPAAFLLIYGVMFAAVLAALYLPAWASLKLRSRQLVDATYPFGGTSDWADYHDYLTDYLGLSSNAFENAQTTLGTLAPLIASLVAFLPSSA